MLHCDGSLSGELKRNEKRMSESASFDDLVFGKERRRVSGKKSSLFVWFPRKEKKLNQTEP